MAVLLLRLAGPLQSWGDSSRFVRRTTRREPTKSGVIGLIASAMGRSREDSNADLVGLDFGVRADQPGRVMCDFQVERSIDGKKVMPLSYRYYLADAKFLVAIAGPVDDLRRIDWALGHPRWPLFLGRRSCPPEGPVSMGVHEEYADVREALALESSIAAKWCRGKDGYSLPALEVVVDAREGEKAEGCSDVPVSFSVVRRSYGSRGARRCRVADLLSELGLQEDEPGQVPAGHDPMGFF